MPRQAIRPEYRQRVSEACRPCKASKKRCDSGHPCALCIKRDRVSSCVYSAPEDRRRPRNSERISTQHASPASISVNVNRSVTSATPRSYSWPPKEPQISMEHETPAAIEDVYLPKSRILLTSAGEKVYTGDTASLSFLQFLRQVLNQQMGPSLFTETKLHNVMLEVPQQGSIQDFEQDPKMVRLLIEGFFVSSSGFLDVYTKSEMAELLIGMDNVSSKATDYRSAALYVAIAIGGQSRADSPLDLQYAREYFARGQRAAFAGMLEDPSIDLIRLFLLMAFYMLGACRRNTAFTYIGIAARAAHTLGLHATAKSRAFDDAEENLRLRIWRSVTIIDMVVSSILARPPATVRTCASSPCDTNIYKPYCQTSNLAVNAAFRVCTIIRDIIKDSGETTDADTASANKSLDKLKQWVADLPNELRRFSETVPLESSDHALVVGNLHAACVYYFTVMLVTRPFLISHLMSRLPKNSSGATFETRTTEPIEDIRLAQICIDTAIYMAQASRHALAAGVLLNNMCIMKAWLFAAGLVLGFSIFGHGEVRFDVEEAFQSVREVLEKFSHQSPQAKHYYEVLTSFNHAISQHRQRIAQQQRLNNAPYITQILRIESNDTLDQHSSTPNEMNQEFHSTDTGTLENCPNAEMSLGTSQLDSNFDQIIASWDPIANQISENYPFDILEGLFTEI